MTDLDREHVRQAVAQVLPVLQAQEELLAYFQHELDAFLGTDYRPEVDKLRIRLYDLKVWCASAGRVRDDHGPASAAPTHDGMQKLTGEKA